MTDLTPWSCDANEAVIIRLKHSAESKKHDVQFPPSFTYPLFGEDELIFGYKGLKIRLDFAADTLKPSLNVTWIERFEPVDDAKPDDVEETVRSCLPVNDDAAASSATDSAWEPPGELLHQYETGGRAFGIWCANLSDPAARNLLANMQILVLFFIEGGSLLDLDDPDWTMERWTIFLIYAIDPVPSKLQASTYTLAGYSTAYRLWFFDLESPLYASSSTTPSPHALPPHADTNLTSQLPCRQRISQFLILPPHQHAGHGSTLYSTMIQHFLTAPTVHEITVEDPNESFDEMRDINDLIRLRATVPAFATLSINSDAKLPSDRSAFLDPSLLVSTDLRKLRLEQKIAPRQFARIAEMQLLSNIPMKSRNINRITRKDRCTDPQDRAYYYWRLFTKYRLYRQNVDQLAQIELEERVEKLEETLTGVEAEYVRVLEVVEKRWMLGGGRLKAFSGAERATAGSAEVPIRGRKRRIVDDEDDDDGEGDGDVEVEAKTAASVSANGGAIVDVKDEKNAPVKDEKHTDLKKENGAHIRKKKRHTAEVVDLSSDP